MHYVVIRDDDTNALTPVEYLDRLYGPFLSRGLPVNLAVIPNVRTDVSYGNGIAEGFLVAKNGTSDLFVPIGENRELVKYLKDNREYHIVQHGCHHEFVNQNPEFDHEDREDIVRRLEQGTEQLMKAGFGRPSTFVAPYDRLTRTSFEEVAKRFGLISSGWYELKRLPAAWWPSYFVKKATRRPHWRVGETMLLSHPGCHLSYHRPYELMLEEIKRSVRSRHLTVLVTHWWEFFRKNRADELFIRVLHDTARFLGSAKDVRVVTFEDVVMGKVKLA